MKLKTKKKVLLSIFASFVCLAVCFGYFFGMNKSSDSSANAIEYKSKTEFVNADLYMNNLVNVSLPDEGSYYLYDNYPMYTENQTTSDLCWAFSSAKVLETSLMKQSNEYHNISDIGMAYLRYLIDSGYNFKTNTFNDSYNFNIDVSGSFVEFNEIAQNLGLVYENTFSNDLFFDINRENYKNYEYILNHLDTTLMDNVRPISFSSSGVYSNNGLDNKTTLLKKYIYTYGGVFAGLEKGIISSMSDTYIRQDEKSNNNDDGWISKFHAVCLVGWDDDKNAFRAINSWGVEYGKYNYFWIPYDYAYMYGTTYGYVTVNGNNDLLLKSSSARGTRTYFKNFKNVTNEDTLSFINNLTNFFVYGENISLSYKLSNRFDFDKIFVHIYQNNSEVTNKFSVEFDDFSRTVAITPSPSSPTLTDCYYIEFYHDKEYIGTRDFYIFTGSEVCYVEYVNANLDETEDGLMLFNNTLAGVNYSQTYYHNEISDLKYYLKFFFPVNYDKISITVGEIYITSTTNDGVTQTRQKNSDDTVSVVVNDVQPFIKNLRQITISNLFHSYKNQMVEININVLSISTGIVQQYKFNFFVSNTLNTTTSDANLVIYNLDGGTNNFKNVNRYPNFEADSDMTAFELYEPVKADSTFQGWFLDPNFSEDSRVYKLDGTISNKLGKYYNEFYKKYYSTLLGTIYSDDIVLYALWTSISYSYYDISYEIVDVNCYGTTDEIELNENSEYVYGSSIISRLQFSAHEDELIQFSYSTRYTYYFNGEEISSNFFNKNSDTILFTNDFLGGDGKAQLTCGEYKIKVKVYMVISHKFIVEKPEIELTFTIIPKQISANFADLEFVYDGKEHIPVVVSFDGKYDIDEEIGYTLDGEPNYAVGTYKYRIVSIDNSNYEFETEQVATLKISQKKISIEWSKYINENELRVGLIEKVYNGREQKPISNTDYVISGIVPGEEGTISLSFGYTHDISLNPTLLNVNEDGYRITIRNINNDNYLLEANLHCIVRITKAKIRIIFDNKSVRFTIAPKVRETFDEYRITYSVEGNLFGESVESLNIKWSSDGPNSTTPGNYVIRGSYDNDNYDAEITNGMYTVEGYYYVFYTLPNGANYEERVESGNNPIGVAHIDKNIFKVPFMSKVEYDKPLAGNGVSDLYITVTVKSYSWILFISLGIFSFVVAYFIVSRKGRINRYR